MRRTARRLALSTLFAAALDVSAALAGEVVAQNAPPAAIRLRRLPGTRPQAAALLASGSVGGVLPFRFSAAAGDSAAGSVVVAFETPAKELLAGVESPRVTLELTVYALDAAGSVVAAQASAVGLERARLGPALDGAALRIVDRLALPQATRALRALLYCRESGAFALRQLALSAHQAAADPAVGLIAPEGGWIEIPLVAAGAEEGRTMAAASGEIPPSGAGTSGEHSDLAPPSAEPDLEDLAGSLRETYRLSSTGDRDGAVLRLAALERATVEADPKRGLARLDRATGRVLAAVERADPGLLLVLALFHQQAALVERSERQYGLAQRNEGLALFLLERLAKLRPDDRELAAAALSGLALPYLESTVPQRAGVLLERALAVGGDEPMRLIVLAAVRTREGDSREAKALLDRALAQAPDNREAALRRALADLAGGNAERAVPPLGLLCSPRREAPGDWIALLACQELTRIEIARSRFAAADERLAAALARWPGEGSLLVARCFVQRQLGNRSAAAALAARALEAAAANTATESPRARFGQGPRAYLLTQRYAAEQAAAFRAAALAIALGVEPQV